MIAAFFLTILTIPAAHAVVDFSALKSVAPQHIQQACSVLDQYLQPAFATEFRDDRENVCAPVWTNTTAPWKSPEQIAKNNAYATADQPDMSIEEGQKKGYSVLSMAEQAKLESDAQADRTRVAEFCCEGRAACLKAMNIVKVEVCKLGTDPTAAEPCIKLPGTYTVTADLFDLVARKSVAIASENLNLLDSAKQKNLIDLRQIQVQTLAKDAEKNKFTIGEIQLSPFRLNGNSITKPYIVKHELAHACSHFRRQLALDEKRSKLTAALAFASQLQLDSRSCQLNQETIDTYKAIFPKIPHANEIVDCFAKASLEGNPEITRTCARSRLEESYADAIAYLTSMDNVKEDLFPARCNYQPSRWHTASSHVLQCLLKYSDKYRSDFARGLGCK
jgi:hypothetical protein